MNFRNIYYNGKKMKPDTDEALIGKAALNYAPDQNPHIKEKVSWGPIIMMVAVVFLVAGFIWYSYYAPCSWYRWNPANNVPVRCIQELSK